METVVWHSQHARGQQRQPEANQHVSQKMYLETILSIIYEMATAITMNYDIT